MNLVRDEVSLIVRLEDNRLPIVEHWGQAISEVAPDLLESMVSAAHFNADFKPARIVSHVPVMPIPSCGWAGRPAIQVATVRGENFTFLPKAVKHKVENMPGEPARIVSTAFDTVHNTVVTITIALECSGLVHCQASIENKSEDTLTVQRLDQYLPVPLDNTHIFDMTGFHARERIEQLHEFTCGYHDRESWEGDPGHDATLWQIACRGTPMYRQGEVWGVHVGWSGNSISTAHKASVGWAGLGGGELLHTAEVTLGKGESYSSPLVFFSYGNGLDQLASRVHRWLRSRDAHPKNPRPVLLNTWEAVYFNQKPQKLMELATVAASVGIERFVLDDGWFSSRRNDRSGLGDWSVSEEVWPEGLTPLVKHIRSLGMEFGIWVEPEMVNLDSDLAREHPDWVTTDGCMMTPEERYQRPLDITVPAAYNYIKKSLVKLISENHVDYLKWDHNSPVLGAGSYPSGPATNHNRVSALYRLIDELKHRFPNLEIESCCGGGGRMDLGILNKAVRVWPSDCIDAHDRQALIRNSLLLLPPEMLGTHVSSKVAHTTKRHLDLNYRLLTSFWGHMGIESDITDWSKKDLEKLAQMVALHKQYRDLLHTGTVYHADLADPALHLEGVISASQDCALFQYVATERMLFRNPPSARIDGLIDEALYDVRVLWESDTGVFLKPHWLINEGEARFSGDYLKKKGIQLPAINPDHSILIRIQEHKSQ